jgi:uncharacterized protein YeaO (DUF488 family)
MKMLTVHTAQFRCNRKDRLDITIKSGDQVFAPAWDMVARVKAGTMTEEEYTERYIAMMRRSYRLNRKRWNEILSLDSVTLVCYCPADSFCHRKILAELLVKCGATYAGELKEW